MKNKIFTDLSRTQEKAVMQMAKGQLFEYAVLFHPKPTKDPAGNDTTPKSTVVVDPTRILAENEKEVRIKASRAIPTEYDDKMELVEILVRPF